MMLPWSMESSCVYSKSCGLVSQPRGLSMLRHFALQDMEEQWASLQSQIEALRAEKKEIVASVVEAEKEVLVMERKVQLEREMQVRAMARQGCGALMGQCMAADKGRRCSTSLTTMRNSITHSLVVQLNNSGYGTCCMGTWTRGQGIAR